MKSILGLVMLALLSLNSCKKSGPNQSSVETVDEIKTSSIFNEDQTSEIWEDYLRLKEALVASNFEKTKKAAQDLSANFAENVDSAINIYATNIVESENLKQQRENFSELTKNMGRVLNYSLAKGTIYKKFCPMAFNNKGAFWYSEGEEIRNPYFGERMLKCGKITDTIQK